MSAETAYGKYEGEQLDVELDGVSEIDVRIVAGEVSVTTGGSGGVRVEVDVVHGPPVEVELVDGVLLVEHRAPRTLGSLLAGGITAKAVVSLVVPEGTPALVRTVSADVFVAGTHAEASISTVSGRITATGLDGDVALRTVSGDIDVESVGGTVRVTSVSGDTTIGDADVEEVSARSVSGDVTLDLWSVPEVDCTSVSGDVALRLPGDAGVDLDAVTVSGRLETTFPDALDAGRRRLRGRIGGGGPRLAVRTTSGDVVVLRRSPADAPLAEADR